MNKVIDSLIHFLKANEIPFDLHTEPSLLRIGMNVENITWQAFAQENHDNRFVMVSKVPAVLKKHQHGRCAELVTRINHKLGFGHFEMDYNADLLGFRTVIPRESDQLLGHELIRKAFDAHSKAVAGFLPTFSAVLECGNAPVAALQDSFGSVDWS